ncbi:MAG: serine/threonine protein kinase, partial [Lachnospiraceae bacterium]|nr:serine/threonine protein kinase [Lachnospiraceae bacterium]
MTEIDDVSLAVGENASDFGAIVLDKNDYPKEFLENYCQIECLASHNGRETFLVENTSNGEKGIATCYDRSDYHLGTDINLLSKLDHPGLPHYYKQIENGRMVCIIREYIEGLTLSDYATNKQLAMPEIVDIAKQLCDILEVLHNNRPQIIHRDIKPENVIVRPDGTIALIDFDIARTVKEGESNDTVFFGTKVYAPPEQYGFGQTDSRADIYAFGVLLRWMVTGNARKNPNISAGPNVEKVIDRCTAFDPNRRYNSIEEVKKALDDILSHKKKRNFKAAICVVLASVLVLAAGFVIGRVVHIDEFDEAVTFEEPLIEQAVRAVLGKNDG